jgi:hypothetical protein
MHSSSTWVAPTRWSSAEIVVPGWHVVYKRQAVKDFRAAEWCFDPYAKQCERCDAVIGRFAVLFDDDGWRHVLFFPHGTWDGVQGSARCRAHSRHVPGEWLRLV